MSQQPAEIKGTLRRMLAEANRAKGRAKNWIFGLGLLFGVCMIGVIYEFLKNELRFGGFMAGLLGFAGGFICMVPAAVLEEKLAAWLGRRLAARFREAFPRETGAYDVALTLLKSAKSENQVEKDLIAALDEDIHLGEAAGGLLGALDSLKAAASLGQKTPTGTQPPIVPPAKLQAKQRPRPEFMPLDPMGADVRRDD